ncbi:MAG: PD40 domain-containing protein [Ignavibacterium sp.]|nr:MAG: PD40 domain-containing protein [Ignavibacterium sp.]
MIRAILLFFHLFTSLVLCQEITSISVNRNNNEYLLPSYNSDGSIYISLTDMLDILGDSYSYDDVERKIIIDFNDIELIAIANNPFLVVKSKLTDKSQTIQLPTSIHYVYNKVFIPLIPFVKFFSNLSTTEIVITNPNRLFVTEDLRLERNQLFKVDLKDDSLSALLHLKMLKPVRYSISLDKENEFHLLLRNTSIAVDITKQIKLDRLVETADVITEGNSVIIKMRLISPRTAYEIIESENANELRIIFFKREESDWYEKESEHFKIIYRLNHAPLVNHILSSAENSLKRLMSIFDYKPSEQIVINTYDVSDYGFGATTTIPQNYIRLEIEPLEPGYEAVPYNERIQWLLSHELVHIVVNDKKSSLSSVIRGLFGKVPPEKTQPFTTIYSLPGNMKRYTPRWYHEGIAVFLETWLSGGYGRTLGNFDEMYFRTFVLERKKFPSQLEIETILSHNSIFLENVFYFYGARFVSYLSIHYSVNQVIEWFKTYTNDGLTGFIGKFNEVFGKDFYTAWGEFIIAEKNFQKENLNILESTKQTEVNNLSTKNFGWVTQPYYDAKTLSVIYGYHRTATLATLQKFHLLTKNSEDLTTLPTPSMYQVASTAFDESNNLFFYTTNNNKLFRDVWVVDLLTKEKKLLFPDSRIGNITISAGTNDLWGVQQHGGLSTLVFTEYPFKSVKPVFTFDFSEELSHLSVTKSGEKLVAVVHQASGQQSIILFEKNNLLSGEPVNYQVITSEGSPENPSWSDDGLRLYWNAYTNGVSNIYRYDFKDSKTVVLTNCITGLFKPVEIDTDSLFAFKFSTDGFKPVMIANKPARYLPAIQYYGQKIIDKDQRVYDWLLPNAAKVVDQTEFSNEESYNGLSNLHLHSFVPVVSGFQNQVVLGFFTRFSDPLLLHDFTMELGVSPFSETPSNPFFHFRFKYDFKQRFYIEYKYNGPDFFDLFNKRKRGFTGSRFKLGHTHYWLYDKPHTVKQEISLAFYRDVKFINDNLVRVSQPDFGVLSFNITSKSFRRTIGSSGFENGDRFSLTLNLFATQFDSLQGLLNGYIDYDRYLLWLARHNVLHLMAGVGYVFDNPNLIQGRFYFGGFGNRGIDNDKVRQFRRVFRFPGVPIFQLTTTKFFKLLLENDFPPIRLRNWALGNQFVNHIDFAIFSQSLVTETPFGNYWIDIGAQMDIKFKHWYNLETTLSAGIAKAWSEKTTDWEWMLSLKLLKN